MQVRYTGLVRVSRRLHVRPQLLRHKAAGRIDKAIVRRVVRAIQSPLIRAPLQVHRDQRRASIPTIILIAIGYRVSGVETAHIDQFAGRISATYVTGGARVRRHVKVKRLTDGKIRHRGADRVREDAHTLNDELAAIHVGRASRCPPRLLDFYQRVNSTECTRVEPLGLGGGEEARSGKAGYRLPSVR